MKRWLLVISVLICLSGCGHKIEMSQIGVVAGFGIDKVENGYRLTAQVVNPSAVAGQRSNSLPVFSISAEGDSLFEAYRQLNNLTAKVLYLPHLSVIVMDETVAKEGLNTVLDFALRNVMIRPNITLAVATNSTAEEVLHILAPSEQIPIEQLDSLSNMCFACTSREVKYNLYTVSGKINDKGSNIVLNSVALIGDVTGTDEGEKSENLLSVDSPVQIKVNGLAVFNGENLVGYLSSEEAQYYNVLIGEAKRYVVNAPVDEQYMIVYEGRSTKVKIKPNIDEKKVEIEVNTEGILMENTYPVDLFDLDKIKEIQGIIEERLKKDLEGLIVKTQTELTSDILGVGSKIQKKEPKKWAEIEESWNEIYQTLSFEVKVKVKVDSVGDIANLKE